MAISLDLLSKAAWNPNESDEVNIAAGNRTWTTADTNKLDANTATIQDAINGLQAGSGGGDYLPTSGGTLTGALVGTTATFSGVVIGATPTAATHLVTKGYVDAAIPDVSTYQTSEQVSTAITTALTDYATTAAVAATYATQETVAALDERVAALESA